jgi:two-component system, OmpR family, response regulator
VLGLEIGGDDYVTKPFSPRELTARVSAILRRGKVRERAEPSDIVLRQGALALNEPAHIATFDNQTLTLTAIEFAILAALIRRPAMVLTREQILDTAYPDNLHVSDRTIDSHIRNIRGKLQKMGCETSIETVHGVGFRMGLCEAGK